MNPHFLAGLAVLGVAVILGVALLCDRYGRRSTPPAPTPASPRHADATREIAAIRASWDHLRERQLVPPPPYRMATDTEESAVVTATRGKHRADA